jgi:fatty acid desaturase
MTQFVIAPNFLSQADAASLHRRSPRFFFVVGLVWIGILCLLTIAPAPSATGLPTWSFFAVPAFLGIGFLQYCLLHAVHEAAHHDLPLRSRARLPVALLVAYPIGLTLSFRDEHLLHHRHFGNPELDVDYSVYEPFPRSRFGLLKFVAFNFSGIGAIAQVLHRAGNKTIQTPWHDSATLVGVQVAGIVCFTLVFGTVNYFIYWLLPLLTVVKGLAQVRGLAEHGTRNEGGGATLRTFLSDGVVGRVLGPFGFRHHAEHHLYPMVPFDNLGKVRERMMRASSPATARSVVIEPYRGNHIQFLWEAFRALPWTERVASRRAASVQ